MIKRGTATLARKQERNYTTLMHDAVEVIKDPVALAIFTYLQTKQENWIVRRNDVMERFGIGKDRYQKAMRHLRDVMLVYNEWVRDDKGQVVDTQMIVNYVPESPDSGSAGLRVSQTSDNPNSGSGGHLPIDQDIPTNQETHGQSVGSTPPLIYDPEPKPNRLDSRENARALAELWNQVIDEHNPNWRKVSTPEVLSAKRERTAKQAINFAKARYKLKHNGTVPTWADLLDWFTRYLEQAAHHEFHSGYHVSPQYPQGFRRDFDLQLRQSTMEKFVDENNEG